MSDSGRTTAAPALIRVAALMAIVAGSGVLVGWAYDIAALKSLLPGWVSMKANTAVGFILIGIATFLSTLPLTTPGGVPLALIARLSALLAGAIGLLTLVEYGLAWNPGVDQWLFVEAPGTVGTSQPGRMAPETALCFVLLAGAWWIAHPSQSRRWAALVSASIGFLVLSLALAALFSYLTPQLGAFGWFGLTIMAVPTATLFALLGAALVVITWRQNAASWSLGKGVTWGFGLSLLLLILVGLNASRVQYWVKDNNRQMLAGETLLHDIEDLLTMVLRNQTDTRGYVINGDPRFLQSVVATRADALGQLNGLRRVGAGAAEAIHQQQFAQLEVAVMAALEWTQEVLAAHPAGVAASTANARDTMVWQGKLLADRVAKTVIEIEGEHLQHLAQMKQAADSVVQFTYFAISLSTLACLTISLFVIFRLNFSEQARRRGEEQLRQASEAIHQLNVSLEARVDERTRQWVAANTRLLESTENLTRANRELEQFAYVASHDLQEPLRVVVGFVQLIEKRLAGKLDAETREFMDFAIAGAHRMQRLIQDVLAYSRLNSPGAVPVAVDCAAAVHEALLALNERIASLGARVEVLALPVVVADRTQLIQLFQNLIGNALKFCQDGVPQVCIEAHRKGAQWRFSITDNGIGVAEEYRERVFGIFQRLHTGNEYEGTGIGLAICKRIVERHGGEIGIETNPATGGGSIVWFTLPGEEDT